MREYEFTFVVQPEISEEGLEALRQKFEGVLERDGATRLFYEDWGRRRLAYEIQKFQKGHYLVLHFLDEGQVIPEIERAARLDDSVLRFLTVVADDDVSDVEARKAEGATLEEERKQRATERATRDAEEAAARAAEAKEAEEAAAARAAEAKKAEEAKKAQEAEDAAEASEAGGEEADATAADAGETKEEAQEAAADAPASTDDSAGSAEAKADDASEAKQPA